MYLRIRIKIKYTCGHNFQIEQNSICVVKTVHIILLFPRIRYSFDNIVLDLLTVGDGSSRLQMLLAFSMFSGAVALQIITKTQYFMKIYQRSNTKKPKKIFNSNSSECYKKKKKK